MHERSRHRARTRAAIRRQNSALPGTAGSFIKGRARMRDSLVSGDFHSPPRRGDLCSGSHEALRLMKRGGALPGGLQLVGNTVAHPEDGVRALILHKVNRGARILRSGSNDLGGNVGVVLPYVGGILRSFGFGGVAGLDQGNRGDGRQKPVPYDDHLIEIRNGQEGETMGK